MAKTVLIGLAVFFFIATLACLAMGIVFSQKGMDAMRKSMETGDSKNDKYGMMANVSYGFAAVSFVAFAVCIKFAF